MDTCSATTREGSRMYICDRPMRHPERTHAGAGHEWPVEPSSSFHGEREVER
jgi:hypothetical protein